MKKSDIDFNDIKILLDSLSDDVEIKSIIFNSKNQIIVQMEKEISTVHTVDKQASLDELMSLIAQLENYSAIDE